MRDSLTHMYKNSLELALEKASDVRINLKLPFYHLLHKILTLLNHLLYNSPFLSFFPSSIDSFLFSPTTLILRFSQEKRREMCYPAVIPLVTRKDLVMMQGRWFILPQPRDDHEVVVAGEAGGGSRGGGSIKQCVCSPSTHPGSFRCRNHHGEYVWGGARITRNVSTD